MRGPVVGGLFMGGIMLLAALGTPKVLLLGIAAAVGVFCVIYIVRIWNE